MSESFDFRMPAQALYTQIAWAVGMAAFVGVSAFALRTSFSLIALVFAFGAFSVATLVVYPLSRRRVWVTTSEAGMQGRGAFGLRVRISWEQPVLIVRSMGSVTGVKVMAVDGDGIPTFASILIPRSILLSASFQAEVARHTAGKHPLSFTLPRVA